MNIDFRSVTEAYKSNNLPLSKIYGSNDILLWELSDQSNNYFTIELLEDIGYVSDLSIEAATSQTWAARLYSINDGEWKRSIKNINTDRYVLEARNYKAGDKIRIKASGYDISSSVSQIATPVIDVCRVVENNPYYYHYRYKVYGNVLSLYTDNFNLVTNLKYFRIKDENGIETILSDTSKLPVPIIQFGSFDTTVSTTSYLEDAGGLSLSANILYSSCYSGMFSQYSSSADRYYGCTSLVNAPELPATTLASNCYTSMFEGCTSLVNAPELPATTLVSGCYIGMFRNCTSLVNAPSLPATTLVSSCYRYMFSGCTSLTTAPVLPATTLPDYCYMGMFSGCKKLKNIKCLATDISAIMCLLDWVKNVSSTGTFIKKSSMTGWPTGNSGIPSRWSIQNA